MDTNTPLKALATKTIAETQLKDLDAKSARRLLKAVGQMDKLLSSAATNLRLSLGRLLVEIQNRDLHKELGHPTWNEFLDEGLSEIAGISRRTAFEAMRWAKSEAIGSLSPEELGKMPLQNASTLVKLEKADPSKAKAPETIQKAQTMSTGQFSREVGQSRGYRVQVWVEDEAAGRELQKIAEFFAGARVDALSAFREFLYSDEIGAMTGDGRDNAIDFIRGVCLNELIVEQDGASAKVALETIEIDGEWVADNGGIV